MENHKTATALTTEQKIKTIVFLIGGGFFIWLFFWPSSSSEENRTHTKSEALVMSRHFVGQQLKAPSTAEYSTESDESVKQINDTTFSVTGYVDSENSFGAKLRSNYSCIITFIPNDKAICDDLVIE